MRRQFAGAAQAEESAERHPVILLVDELIGRGGTEMHLISLARALKARGHLVEIWTFRLSPQMQEVVEPTGVPVQVFPVRGVLSAQLPLLLRRLRAHARALLGDQPFVLQSYHIAADITAASLAYLLPQAAVVSTRRDMGFTRKAIHDLVLRALDGRVERVLAVSDSVKWAVARREGQDPRGVEVIHNGVDTQSFRPARSRAEVLARQQLRAELGHGPEDVLLVCVGSFQPVKGQGSLLEAMVRLHQRAPRVRALLVGGRPDYRAHHVRLAERLGLSGAVQFLGERSDIAEILRASDIFVLPSWSEGFSNAVLEAMASGLPVVTTDVGGNRAAVTPELGAVVPPGDAARLARALEPLCLDDERRKKAGQAARRAAVEVFDLERMVDRYLASHREALRRVHLR